MSPCSHVRDQLADVALGLPATPEFTRHLAACAACAEELQRQSALARRLDAAVLGIVRAEPPPELSAGVAARLGAAARPSTRKPVRVWSAALAAVAACAVIASLGFRALERPPAAPSELSALSTWRSPTASLLEPLDASPHTLSHPSPGASHDS